MRLRLAGGGRRRAGERERQVLECTGTSAGQAVVAGVPDEWSGEAVKAWVVLRAGQDLTVEELRAYCKRSLAPYKVPKQIEFRDGLPKSAIGKVLRRELARGHPSRPAVPAEKGSRPAERASPERVPPR